MLKEATAHDSAESANSAVQNALRRPFTDRYLDSP